MTDQQPPQDQPPQPPPQQPWGAQQWQPQQGQPWQQPGGPQPPAWGPPWQQPSGPQYAPQPYPGGRPGRRARPPRKRRRINAVILSVVGVLIVVIAVGAALGSSKNNNKGPGNAAAGSTPSASPAAQTTTPAISAAQQQFVSDVQSSTLFNVNSSVTAADIASYGQQVCDNRKTSESQTVAITSTRGQWTNMSAMMADAMVRLAEKDICPAYLPRQTITYVVKGTPGASQVTYGPDGSNFNGNTPMRVVAHLGQPQYYAISAQLQGSGTVTCVIKVDGIPLSTATANGGYNIADCEISQDPITNLWEDTNSA